MAANNTLYVTYVEKYGQFLKVWGQMERQLPVIIEKSLTHMNPQFEQGMFMPTLDTIQCGCLCCAKYTDGNYYRARIVNIAMLHQNLIEVHFVDFGNKDLVPTANLRTIADFAPGLIAIPPQAKDFILSNVTSCGPGWDTDTVTTITNEIRYLELSWVAVSQLGPITFIKLFKNNEDIACSLYNRGLVLSIASSAQHMILQNTIVNTPPAYHIVTPVVSNPIANSPPINYIRQQSTPAPAASPPLTLLGYKSINLDPGTDIEAYISYVSDGPCHFSIQLKKLEDTLARLMKELNRMPLHPLEDDPIPGTVCVAPSEEDDHICRAVVTSLVDGQYKVFFVDFGNTEIVPLEQLYQIPFKYVLPKIMAMRFALAGLDRSSVTLEMKCAFKEFVNNKMLRMRPLSSPTRSALPLCQLWDENNVSVLDVLRQAALLAYPETIQLTRGFTQEIRVSYVHSCNHFYVQIKSKEGDLCRVMEELQANCPQAKPLHPSQVKNGLPCCALFDTDGQWYRAQILCKEGENVKVRYVDYGNEELVAVSNLRIPFGEQITALRPQALECCLNGYQNMEDDVERDNILEEIILEKEFIMKVVEMQGNRALVDLNDSLRYNVASLLLEKLATAKSQVSPLLIQDSHHIEQRKRQSPSSSVAHRLERRSSRTDNDRSWNNQDKGFNKDDKTDKVWNNRKDSWRETRPPSTDNNDRGWNNQDKGFNKEDKADKGWNNKKDSWRETRPPRRDDGEDRSTGDSFDKNKGRRDGFKKDSWNTNGEVPSWKKDTKSNQNNREGSEKSFSDGSEKSWRRPQNQNEDRRPRRKFDDNNKGSGSSWNSGNQDNKWNSGSQDNKWNDSNKTKAPVIAKVLDPAPNTAVFTYPDLIGRCENVLISWFHDPGHFFCQLQEHQAQFRTMMEEIQDTYSKIKSDHVPVNAPAIALFPEDGVMYRARVLEMKAMQYRVQYVDFGNIATTSKVWPIENKFMQLAAQALRCGLSGVVPVDSAWPNPDSFSAHFEKETYACSFISTDGQNYLVELSSDNSSISEALVSAGLAKYDAGNVGAQQNLDPNLLLGQQIRIILGDLQSLDAFYVCLQNQLQILCTVHNLATATTISEDTLKACIGNVLIMYVDNVLEEKMEITLYDTLGNKLNIVEPDEGAFDTVELPCPLPIFYPTINGWITYLTPADNDQHSLFIQPAEYADTLAQLLEILFNHYDSTSLETPLVPEVGLLYAVHSSDANWYRGKVISVEDQTVTVTFVDYGNSESVSITELRELAPEFLEQHLLAIELLASGVDHTFIEQEVTANVWYGDNGWEAEVHKSDPSATQTQPETLLNDQPAAAAAQHPSENLPPQPSEVKAVSEVTESASEPPVHQNQLGMPVILSHIDSPSEFYLQLSGDVLTIENLQATLQEQVSSFPDLENPTAGVLCAAQYSVDQQWYRAQVLDADIDITTVRFVDYGNTDVLTNSNNHVKTLSSDLLSLEQHARRCSLILKPTDAEWSPAAYERFEVLTGVDNLSAEILHQDEKTTYIELYADGVNVAESLLQENLAVKLQLEMQSSCTGYVSHLNSPSEFWVQLENSVADLEWIAEQLSAAENFPELEDLTPGSICAALFPDDEMWYRARILSNTVAGLEVLFVDYGNSCTCTGLRQLPEDLIMLAPLAQKCSLQKPAGMLQWSTQATDEFRSISADGATIFNIDKLGTGETSVVRLLLEGEDISTKLLPTTEAAYISHFESVSCFWIQKEADVPKLDVIIEKLLAAAEWPKYEKKEDCEVVAALYPTDEQWYRARILSVNESVFEVLFIDYGNTTSTSEIRLLACDAEKESPLAAKYKLEPLPGFRWNEESSTKLAEISNAGVTQFQAEFSGGDAVRLYLNGNDVRSNLDSISVTSAHSTPKKGAAVLKVNDILPHGIDTFLDSHSESPVVCDVNVEDVLVVETSQEQPSENIQYTEQTGESLVLTEDEKFETASSMNEGNTLDETNRTAGLVTKAEEVEKCEISHDINESKGEGIRESEVGEKTVLDKEDLKLPVSEIMEPTSKDISEDVKAGQELASHVDIGKVLVSSELQKSEAPSVSANISAPLGDEKQPNILTTTTSAEDDKSIVETNSKEESESATDNLNSSNGNVLLLPSAEVDGIESRLHSVSEDLVSATAEATHPNEKDAESNVDSVGITSAQGIPKISFVLEPVIPQGTDISDNRSEWPVTGEVLAVEMSQEQNIQNEEQSAELEIGEEPSASVNISTERTVENENFPPGYISRLLRLLTTGDQYLQPAKVAEKLDSTRQIPIEDDIRTTEESAECATIDSEGVEIKDFKIIEGTALDEIDLQLPLSKTRESGIIDSASHVHVENALIPNELEISGEPSASVNISTETTVEKENFPPGYISRLLQRVAAGDAYLQPAKVTEQLDNTRQLPIEDRDEEDDMPVTTLVAGDDESMEEVSASEEIQGVVEDEAVISRSSTDEVKTFTAEEISEMEPSLRPSDQDLVSATDDVRKLDTTDDATSLDIPQQSSTEDLGSSQSPVYTPQRRSSIPHSEKIVPGSVSRGDLATIEGSFAEQLAEAEVVPAVNECGESNKNEQSANVVRLCEESPKVSPRTSFCKVDVDERIVPGALSRGETPEPPPAEDVSLGAANGDI